VLLLHRQLPRPDQHSGQGRAGGYHPRRGNGLPGAGDRPGKERLLPPVGRAAGDRAVLGAQLRLPGEHDGKGHQLQGQDRPGPVGQHGAVRLSGAPGGGHHHLRLERRARRGRPETARRDDARPGDQVQPGVRRDAGGARAAHRARGVRGAGHRRPEDVLELRQRDRDFRHAQGDEEALRPDRDRLGHRRAGQGPRAVQRLRPAEAAGPAGGGRGDCRQVPRRRLRLRAGQGPAGRADQRGLRRGPREVLRAGERPRPHPRRAPRGRAKGSRRGRGHHAARPRRMWNRWPRRAIGWRGRASGT